MADFIIHSFVVFEDSKPERRTILPGHTVVILQPCVDEPMIMDLPPGTAEFHPMMSITKDKPVQFPYAVCMVETAVLEQYLAAVKQTGMQAEVDEIVAIHERGGRGALPSSSAGTVH